MLQKLQSDNDDLMEIFQRHYAELRREHSEFKDTAHKLECEVAGLRGKFWLLLLGLLTTTPSGRLS